MKDDNLSEKEKVIIKVLTEAFKLIDEGDGLSLYVFMVKAEGEGEDKMVTTIENLKGQERDIFAGLCGAKEDEKPSATKNLLSNFFYYEAAQIAKKNAEMNDEAKEALKVAQNNMKVVKKPKGDA